MATSVGNILSRVRAKLNDLGSVRWPDSEHIEAINDAQKSILEARPDLLESYTFVVLVKGTVQSVPADCYLLFDVIGNADVNNNLTSPVSFISRSTMDRHHRAWMSETASAQVIHWMQDDREKAKFHVYPPQPTTGSGRVQIRYAKRPADVTAVGSNVGVPDECINALYHFCMTRALEKDEKFSGSPQAQEHFSKFALFLSAKTEAENQSDAYRTEREDVA